MRATTLPIVLGVGLGMSLMTAPVPGSAVAPSQSSPVRNLKVKVLSKQCVRVTWRAPSTGKAFYKWKVGGANMPYASFRTPPSSAESKSADWSQTPTQRWSVRRVAPFAMWSLRSATHNCLERRNLQALPKPRRPQVVHEGGEGSREEARPQPGSLGTSGPGVPQTAGRRGHLGSFVVSAKPGSKASDSEGRLKHEKSDDYPIRLSGFDTSVLPLQTLNCCLCRE